MVKNAGSRVFHGFMVVPCAILCLLAIISFSSFAYLHDKIRDDMHDAWKDLGVTPRYCILYTEHARGINVTLSDDHTCVFAIWGEVVVSFIALLLGMFFIVKAIIGIHVLTFFSVIELVIVVLAALLDFVVAIVISAGLDQTCRAFDEAAGEDVPCSSHFLRPRKGSKVEIHFYSNINAARSTAWVGTVLLVILIIGYTLLLFAYCYRRKHSPETAGYEQAEPLTASNEPEDKTDPVPV